MIKGLENVRSAWVWAVAQKWIALLAEIAPFTKRCLDLQRRYCEGIALFQQALDGFDSPVNADVQPPDECGHLLARLLMYKSILIADADEPEAALQTLKSCLAYFRKAGDGVQLMVCLKGLGNASRFLGQEEEAIRYSREELELTRAMGNRNEEGMALNNLALSINPLGQFEEAENLRRQCLALCRELDDYSGISSSLINLGVVLFNQHKFQEAKPLLYEAIEITGRLNHTRNKAATLGNLGGILMQEGHYEEALKLFMQGLEIHRNTGYRFGTAIALDVGNDGGIVRKTWRQGKGAQAGGFNSPSSQG